MYLARGDGHLRLRNTHFFHPPLQRVPKPCDYASGERGTVAEHMGRGIANAPLSVVHMVARQDISKNIENCWLRAGGAENLTCACLAKAPARSRQLRGTEIEHLSLRCHIGQLI